MADINEILDGLKDGIKELAKKEAKDFVVQAQGDAEKFLDDIKQDLATWVKQLAKGELSENDFKFLVRGRKDVAEMAALKQAGLAQVAIQRIVNGVIDLVVDAAVAAT